MTVGQRIKQLRLERKWRPTYLALEIGMEFCSIYWYESGKRYPSMKTLFKMCDAFGITPEQFFKGVEEI